jgi:hypothetical protein
LVDRITSALGQSADLLDDAHTNLATATAGTAQPEVEQVVGTFAEARQDNTDLLAQCHRLRAAIAAILTRIVGLIGEGVPLPVPEDRVHTVREMLPPPIAGTQTAGWWLHPDGGRTRVLSGQNDDPDGWQQQAERFLAKAFPGRGPGLLALSRHVEIQVAFRLLGTPASHQVVVINRKVCRRDVRRRMRQTFTCDEVLPFVLEEGTTLTVVQDDGSRITYRGRRRR